ncbi:sensor histidine kinase [Tissierella pigra]|uniref:Heme sensor protein HssS n=1 Tax=Tissierella pigra TaxID=2607614 RepID=A0A6N7XFC7_9FIRM|nr:HAMP domain-containing sensor histidine kinase [Tissierella pigra]MSU00689.1 HAMP domain-containing histidine kinase [Tissierella pigra]
MKKIAVKLALFFIIIIYSSSFLSFIISTIFTENIEDEIKLNQFKIANSILQLYEKTDLSIEEIADITSTSTSHVSKIENIDLFKFTEKELEKIYNHEPVFSYESKRNSPVVVLFLDDSFIQISLYPKNTIFKIVVSRVWFTMLVYVAIGSLCIILLSKRIVKPILELTSATQEVAKGNFDVSVEVERQDEIGQLTHNFNKMTKELKNIEYLRKDFITNVSHEFKTPIASIQGFARLLQKGKLTEIEREEYTDIIAEETVRLSKLSSNILKLSKLESQEIVERKTEFSLDEQIRKSILLLEYEWSKKNIEFDIELHKVKYAGDEGLFQQVWINLLGNAIKFSRDNSVISIKLEEIDSMIRVEIKDNGVGMSEEVLQRIFERFYQGDRSHSAEGNGLGLPLVKKIIDLYGGNIHVHSIPNIGSVFTVELIY